MQDNHNMNTANKSLKTVAVLRYLGKTATNQNYIHGEGKS
jgi:hypothetical protein